MHCTFVLEGEALLCDWCLDFSHREMQLRHTSTTPSLFYRWICLNSSKEQPTSTSLFFSYCRWARWTILTVKGIWAQWYLWHNSVLSCQGIEGHYLNCCRDQTHHNRNLQQIWMSYGRVLAWASCTEVEWTRCRAHEFHEQNMFLEFIS